MSEELKVLRDNTDRRFAILMTGLQDFMAAYQQERNQMQALLDISQRARTQKAAAKKPTKEKRTRKPKKPKPKLTPNE